MTLCSTSGIHPSAIPPRTGVTDEPRGAGTPSRTRRACALSPSLASPRRGDGSSIRSSPRSAGPSRGDPGPAGSQCRRLRRAGPRPPRQGRAIADVVKKARPAARTRGHTTKDDDHTESIDGEALTTHATEPPFRRDDGTTGRREASDLGVLSWTLDLPPGQVNDQSPRYDAGTMRSASGCSSPATGAATPADGIRASVSVQIPSRDREPRHTQAEDVNPGASVRGAWRSNRSAPRGRDGPGLR